MNIHKFFIILFLILCIAFSNSQVFADEKVETVTIQLKWLHQFQFAGYYAAVEKGFYAEEGLNVVLNQHIAYSSFNSQVNNRMSDFLSHPYVVVENVFSHPTKSYPPF